MSMIKAERLIAPSNQPDTHIEQRHGVKTRRQITLNQDAVARRVPRAVISFGNGSVVLGPNVRRVNFTGAGVTVTVVGDLATVVIP